MSRQPIGHHAPTHLPGGEDPIPGLGGYVFLEEVIVASNGDPISFASVTQAYRHLVLEMSVRIHGATGNQAGITWNGHAGSNYSMGWIKVDSASTVTGTAVSDSYVGVTVPDINNDTFTDPIWTQITAKFDYYALASRVKSCVWQATSIGENGTVNGAASSGGGQSVADIDSGEVDSAPISSIDIVVTSGAVITGQWAADCRASLYGIG